MEWPMIDQNDPWVWFEIFSLENGDLLMFITFLELNCVKLMGTIVDNVSYLKNGIMKLNVKTVTEENSE